MNFSVLSNFFLFLFTVWCFAHCAPPPQPGLLTAGYQATLDSIQAQFAPDRRVVLLTAEFVNSPNQGCPILRGRTTLAAAASALRQSLERQNLCFQDSFQLLPAPQLGADTLGLVNVSVANLRTQASHAQELATQALLGTPLRVYEQNGDWWLVQTPDGYLAWLESGAFVRLNRDSLNHFLTGPLALVNVNTVRLKAAFPRELSLGNLVRLGPQNRAVTQVFLPDGSTGTLATADLLPFPNWQERSRRLDLPALSLRFYGLPYLWGGTSDKAVDCSGLTKMIYYLNGLVIPRDASQQVLAGLEVPITDSLEQLLPGDLLFFGALRPDGTQRINHVGLYLGAGRFVHSGADNGFVREQSLLPDTPGFAAHRRQTLLRVKRLLPGGPGVHNVIEYYTPQSARDSLPPPPLGSR